MMRKVFNFLVYLFLGGMILFMFLNKPDRGRCTLRKRTQNEYLMCMNGCSHACDWCRDLVCEYGKGD